MTKPSHHAITEKIGKAIALRRNQAGLTQEQVAEKLNIGNEAVSRLERGVAMITVARLFELANIFGCETADLLLISSPHIDDQVRYFNQMLSALNQADRQLLLSIMEQLSSRLSQSVA